jgi:hypothetical protein
LRGNEIALTSPYRSTYSFHFHRRPPLATGGKLERRRAPTTALTTIALEQKGQQHKDEGKPDAVHLQHLFRRGIGFKQHVGSSALRCRRIAQSELDVGFVLVELVNEEAVHLGGQECQQDDAKEHQGRVVDFNHVLLRRLRQAERADNGARRLRSLAAAKGPGMGSFLSVILEMNRLPGARRQALHRYGHTREKEDDE